MYGPRDCLAIAVRKMAYGIESITEGLHKAADRLFTFEAKTSADEMLLKPEDVTKKAMAILRQKLRDTA